MASAEDAKAAQNLMSAVKRRPSETVIYTCPDFSSVLVLAAVTVGLIARCLNGFCRP
jgi:hypothetical protein